MSLSQRFGNIKGAARPDFGCDDDEKFLGAVSLDGRGGAAEDVHPAGHAG